MRRLPSIGKRLKEPHNGQNKMYRIAACFKITDDFDELTAQDWRKPFENGRPVTNFVRRILGCFDEATLENALLLRNDCETANITTKLSAVTINPGYSEHILKRIKAVGYDNITCLRTDENLDFRPDVTAGLLTEYIKQEQADIVLCGMQSAPGNTGTVPVLLAEKLKYDIFNSVVRITVENGKIFALCEYKQGYLKYRLTHKSVCVMGNTEKSYLRIPTLKEKLAVKDFAPEIKECQVGADERQIEFEYAAKQRNCNKKEMSEDSLLEILNGLEKFE